MTQPEFQQLIQDMLNGLSNEIREVKTELGRNREAISALAGAQRPVEIVINNGRKK